MSANRFTEFPPRRDLNPVCFYCGEGFEDDVHVEWHGHGKVRGGVGVDLHVDCARDLSIHLASDYLKAGMLRQGYYPAGWRKTLGPHIT